jgi:hypothetical protein
MRRLAENYAQKNKKIVAGTAVICRKGISLDSVIAQASQRLTCQPPF